MCTSVTVAEDYVTGLLRDCRLKPGSGLRQKAARGNMAAIINNSADFITLETAPINPVYNAPTPTQATFSEYQGIEEPHKKGLKRKISKTEPLLLMCELCQVSLNSANQASQHYQGKIHQAKVCSSRGENLSEWVSYNKANGTLFCARKSCTNKIAIFIL